MSIKVAGIQAGPYPGSYEENMKLCNEALDNVVKKEQPYIVAFSELMTAPYFGPMKSDMNVGGIDPDSFFDYAESKDGPTVTTLTRRAKELNTHIIGTFMEKAVENGATNYYNSACLLSPTKGLIGIYRKVHLPKIHTETFGTDEKYYFEKFGGAGKEFPVFELDNGTKIGILICFDRSFPEAYRSLLVKGAQIVFVLVATWGFRSETFLKELEVRAMENQFYIVEVNKAGDEQNEGEREARDHFGKSAIIHPSGKIIKQIENEQWGHIAEEIDLKEIEKVTQVINFKNERKPQAYADILA